VDVLVGVSEVEIVQDILIEHRDGVALEIAQVQIPEEGVDRVAYGNGIDGLSVPPGIVEGQGIDGENVDVVSRERVVDDEVQIAGIEIIHVLPGGHDFFDGGVGVDVFPLFELEIEIQGILDGLVAVEDRVIEGFACQPVLTDVGLGEVGNVVEDAETVSAEIFDGQKILRLRGLGFFLSHDIGRRVCLRVGEGIGIGFAFTAGSQGGENKGQDKDQ
jgi:hypothetical protein